MFEFEDRHSNRNKTDWTIVIIYAALVLLGWLNIYAADYDPETSKGIFDLSNNAGKQLMWIGTCFIIVILIMVIDFSFFDSFAYPLFGLVMIVLVGVLLFGKEIAGSRSWFQIGSLSIQPSEFAKFATALAVAKYFGRSQTNLTKTKDLIIATAIPLVPVGLIILQGDTGTALVFFSFIIAYYREGISPMIIVLGLGVVVLFVVTLLVSQTVIWIAVILIGLLVIGISLRYPKRILLVVIVVFFTLGITKSVNFMMEEVLKPHQRNRITALINPNFDPLGYGWNVTQSKIAIGSGGFWGKGYLKGTQTKFDFVPEQSTDFIFCTVGEEQGWIGSLLLVGLFLALFIRIISVAERQKSKFSRVYAYGVLGILVFHFMINIGMTIGFFPVIGIPLPFFSYGGSSLWSFTVLLFILVKLDSHRMNILMH